MSTLRALYLLKTYKPNIAVLRKGYVFLRGEKVRSMSSTRTALFWLGDALFCRACFKNQFYHTLLRPKKFRPQVFVLGKPFTSKSDGNNDKIETNAKKHPSSAKVESGQVRNNEVSGGIIKKLIKKDVTEIDFNKKYYENTFISDTRAMSDYLLKPSDLEGLKTRSVRSAYTATQNPTDRYFLKSDVEKRAHEVWGSPEALAKEIWLRKKALEEDEKFRKGLASLIGHLKKSVKDHSRRSHETMLLGGPNERELKLRGSARVVGYAMLSNLSVMLFKFGAYFYTGSATMLSESIHSLADLLNQCLLAIGIRQSIKKPSTDHPYGWSTARYVYSLISGVGIFFLGAGVSVYHGVCSLIVPTTLENLLVAYTILGGSFIMEGASLIVALNQLKISARESGVSLREYLIRGRDPTSIAVLMEDGAAVTGVTLAALCLGLASYTGSPVYDAIGSLMIGGLLGTVAFFLISRNADFLIGRSMPPARLKQIIEVLESDIIVRSIHDVKATEMGADTVRFKAEVNFDGREITRCHISRVDMEQMLAEVHKLTTVQELEQFMLEYGEQVIDVLGQQVDRIEKNIKKKNPEVRHVDLEIL
ncbi:zinc transporter 9-like [Actinia tenebrosa]|uniref:Proton-coupled zinc antiporter SLC30A9, mitochondrial n=1 Tax=Actinia tenebrosa TaxID=6105 RepID=A0A6P8HF17_ACTTE|nr:zinc transporter 9-like [Actinia tenebrosa]